MTKGKRLESETKTYHVVTAGMGKQVIFETESDRRYFMKLVEKYMFEEKVELLAWCLMGNHTHLLLRAELHDLSRFMLRLETAYVCAYNKKHDRKGPLFGGRFWSDSIETDERLLAAVRYVHRNPVKARIAHACSEYAWSSYREYTGDACITNTELVLQMLGGIEQFVRFHQSDGPEDDFTGIDKIGKRLTNEEALAVAHKAFGASSLSGIANLSKHERDEKLHALKDLGLSHRQVRWVTGAGLGVIARA